ncbi:hypothetical protein E2C01_033699 [Portunus trituberculatus]|uniref:Uncharacterized protein n=1 Tax=Portunus trituberculatus TaxID=210409 RepID=A0A5B7F6B9_PORTR|nr:hypothetical protein [Portunus trituberculatus]
MAMFIGTLKLVKFSVASVRLSVQCLDGKTLFEAEGDPGSLQLGGGDKLAPRDSGGSGGGPQLVPRVEAAVSMSRLFLSREKLLRAVQTWWRLEF